MRECDNCGVSKNDALRYCPICGAAMHSVSDDALPPEAPYRHTLTEIEKIKAFSKKKRKGWPFLQGGNYD